MAEIVTIPDKVKTSDIPDSELNTIGKFSKKVIHHNAGAPTAANELLDDGTIEMITDGASTGAKKLVVTFVIRR